MAQQQTNPRIEDLKARVRLDPKSRLFYPLAEELRKIGQYAEAERILRDGLRIHTTYLSAWIGLGRVLRDTDRNAEAAEVLGQALKLDPGNVVAARLAADAYFALGEKLEALKKYKLVYALLPADPEVEGLIDKLDREVNPQRYTLAPVQMTVEEPSEAREEAPFERDEVPPPAEPEAAPRTATQEMPFGFEEPAAPSTDDSTSVFFDSELPEAAPVEQPFESASSYDEPVATGDSGAELSGPAGEQVFEMPDEPRDDEPSRAEPEPAAAAEPEASPFGDEPAMLPAEEPEPVHTESDLTATLTMADLYARQGYVTAAREIYERILANDPGNLPVREKLSSLPLGDAQSPEVKRRETVQRLEKWLTRVARHEGRHV